MKEVAVDLNQVAGQEALTSMLKFFVPPLTREIHDYGAPEEVRKRAQEVSDSIKGNELVFILELVFVRRAKCLGSI